MGVISAPVSLSSEQSIEEFHSGNDTLDEWLQKRALKNETSGASRTFVISAKKRVIGYYALASGSVERMEAPKSIARNMPEPIPVIILGRLAIDVDYQGQQLGSALLRDAMLRTLNVNQEIGVRALLVHAISMEAKHFYQRYGFQESLIDEMTLFLSVKNIRASLKG